MYHGSILEIPAPDISLGRSNLDFGSGFYVTTLQQQAEKWAARRAKPLKRRGEEVMPIVSVYEFDSQNLEILTFDGYTEEWLDFVSENRAKSDTTKIQKYDAVFGNIADDDVAATIDEYIRLIGIGRVNIDVKMGTLYQLTFSEPNNQYCITTQKGINALKFIKSYSSEE